MAATQIAVINASSVLTDDTVRRGMDAVQVQIHRDFASLWGIDADLIFVPRRTAPPAAAWWLIVLDNSDEAGALGYHDITTRGLPLGKVFAATDLKYKLEWTVTLSHEALEMLADPWINLTVYDDAKRRLYAYENCDPVEADILGYRINGLLVSDFVTPQWFEPFWKKRQVKFDMAAHVQEPFQILPGGYIGYLDVGSSLGWQILSKQSLQRGKTPPMQARAPLGSRRERRALLTEHWMRSTVEVA